MFTFTPARDRVNLVVKDHTIRYIQAKPGSTEVITFGEKHLAPNIVENGKIIDGLAFQSVLAELATEKEWKAKPLYFCVSDSAMVIRPFTVPRDIKEDEIKGYLFMQLGESLHLPFDTPVFDYSIITAGPSGYKLLLFAYPEKEIQQYRTAFEEERLKAKSADLTSLSVYRYYEYLGYHNAEEHVLSIQWNIDACIVTVFYAHKPVFVRNMKSDLPLDQWTIKDDTYVFDGFEDQMKTYLEYQLNEIERIMDFYKFSMMGGEQGVDKLLVSGDWPDFHRVETLLDQTFNLPIESLRPNEIHSEGDDFVPPSYAEVIGLALKA
ncbi:type IV pilus biogenesis protein PilM [Thalassobacillus sp. CUG 92003]|uniref:type IV pilus biogenesis protein PilM n=1 Tax=Thalassobacillus sp. CUG 92003 TaxID=2736641 RepID=UPI0015E6C592|nr:pilus assembly protein PilM [Thalassobacillus sp. CUG 92003]